MSISDFKDLWNVQPAPRSCMRRDEATLETEVSDFDARGESRTDLIRVLQYVYGVWDARWTNDWHDVLEQATVSKQARARDVAHAERSATKCGTEDPVDLYADDKDEDELTAISALAEARWHDAQDAAAVRTITRHAHVIDADAADILAAAIFLAQSNDHTLEKWRAYGRRAVGLVWAEPSYHFTLSQNCWNYPMVHSPVGRGAHTPYTLSPPSSTCSVITPSDGMSPPPLVSAYMPTIHYDQLAVHGESWTYSDFADPAEHKVAAMQEPLVKMEMVVHSGAGSKGSRCLQAPIR